MATSVRQPAAGLLRKVGLPRPDSLHGGRLDAATSDCSLLVKPVAQEFLPACMGHGCGVPGVRLLDLALLPATRGSLPLAAELVFLRGVGQPRAGSCHGSCMTPRRAAPRCSLSMWCITRPSAFLDRGLGVPGIWLLGLAVPLRARGCL